MKFFEQGGGVAKWLFNQIKKDGNSESSRKKGSKFHIIHTIRVFFTN